MGLGTKEWVLEEVVVEEDDENEDEDDEDDDDDDDNEVKGTMSSSFLFLSFTTMIVSNR